VRIRIAFLISALCLQPAVAATTPASAITQPPLSMESINDNHKFFSGGLDPKIVTLGPTEGTHPELGAYEGKVGDNFEVPKGAPILAPLDGKLIGFNNRNSDMRYGMDGTEQVPFDDLQLCFESRSKDWPGLIYCFYHLKNSPLLLGINKNKLCSNADIWPGPLRAEGRQFYTENDVVQASSKTSRACDALLNRVVTRGAVIGYAGNVGTHSQAPIMVKVKGTEINPTVKNGDRYLHWVQPDVFFYWKCFSPKAVFEPGVLAYPFECDGFKLPATQRKNSFKYKK
jgi:hypothetical protein